MPVTQRWVHAGLVVTVMLLSLSLTVLILGGTRRGTSNAGLPGAQAVTFYLPDTSGKLVALDNKHGRIAVLMFVSHDRSDFSKFAPDVRQIANLYGDDPKIELLGINYMNRPSLLGPSNDRQSELSRECPMLNVLHDVDGAVARAYRVNGTPMVIVIDANMVIRGRIDLTHEDAVMTASEIINNLRDMPLPVTPMIGVLDER